MKQQGNLFIREEWSKADFGDKRLSNRLSKLANSISRKPGASFPSLTGSVANLEAAYRFLGNENVTPDKIMTPHIEATVARSFGEERIIIAHDRTEFLFGGQSRKEALGSTKQNNQGFIGHFCLALSRTTFVRPLGVLGFQPIFRKYEPKRKKKTSEQRKLDPNREFLSWWNSVHKSEYLFPAEVKPIHVMDREADDFELLSDLVNHNLRFVIRLQHNRVNCQLNGKQEKTKLFTLLSGLKAIGEREVPLTRRNPCLLPGDTKRHPPRRERIAKLHVAATTIEIPQTPTANTFEKTVKLNCVHVYELDGPADAEPIDWKLFTGEPIESEKDLFNIIDDYRARWTIEEYFKALKTGCSYEKRQLESREALLNALAVFAPIAYQLLLLKTLNRHAPNTSAECALTKLQIEVLRAVSVKELNDSPTIEEALLAVAALGGHIPNNGPAGWLVLARGIQTLLTMEIAWTAAIKRCDQS